MKFTKREERILSFFIDWEEWKCVPIFCWFSVRYITLDNFIVLIKSWVSKSELSELFIFKEHYTNWFHHDVERFSEKHKLVWDLCEKYNLNKGFFGIKELKEHFAQKRSYDEVIPKLRDKKKWFVYFIASQDWFVKIWRTKNMNWRMQKYITENPNQLTLINKIEYYDYEEWEKHWHEYYSQYRYRWEWFKLPQDQVDYIKSL